ncbi:MAG: succinyl-diaminopimelate desuccinylase [Gammaproteobacteria bacterium]|nr:succinyl-diaminopimelate desuccinylase [Gammaproteobacteria bacterium]
MVDRTLALAMELIARPSVTPDDAGCLDLLIPRLQALGFKTERLRFSEVDNLWAERGTDGPLVVFAGHTDVVPSGPRESWNSDPFVPVIRDGLLYGRGAADMKSSIAAFITAIEDFSSRHPVHSGRIGLLLTSDEEGPAVNGTVKVLDWLKVRGIGIQYCIIGEPTSADVLGDVIKNGRRGSLNARLTIHGIQGHVAYPHLACNPIHAFAPALAELTTTVWDHGNADFMPTGFQVSNIHSGTGAVNVIPGQIELDLNFRFATAITDTALRERVEAILQRHGVKYSIQWKLSGPPYLTARGKLTGAAQAAVKRALDIDAKLSTDGGTSDGRFISPTGAEVIELGPLNASIHKLNEHVRVEDPARLASVYVHLLELLFSEDS